MKIRVISEFYDKFHTSTLFKVGAVLDFEEERARKIVELKLGEFVEDGKSEDKKPVTAEQEEAKQPEAKADEAKEETKEEAKAEEVKVEDKVAAEAPAETPAEAPMSDVEDGKSEDKGKKGKK